MNADPIPEANCIFCRIVSGEIPATVVASNDGAIAFQDLDPKAPRHLLVIPRTHSANVAELAQDASATAAVLGLIAELGPTQVGAQSDIPSDAPEGFRVVFNTGAAAGQTVFHVHAHVLSGRSMTWPPG